MKAAPTSRMSWEEYLAHEESSEVKHEFHDGVLVAMVGVTRAHSLIAGNLFAAIRPGLRRGHCQAHMADFKVRVEAVNRAFYPDVLVSCDRDASGRDLYATDVPFIGEVLSASTEAFDRGDKFDFYKQLPSLREYMLLDTKAVSVDLFRRNAEGLWTWPARYRSGDTVELTSLELTLAIDDLYLGAALITG